jgi:hypothetical protein
LLILLSSETKQKTLEEIAAAFGDELVEAEVQQDVLTKDVPVEAIETKTADAAHIEERPGL